MAVPVRPDMIDDENPEWTDADFGAARPAQEMLPPALYAALVARSAHLRRSVRSGSIALAIVPSDISEGDMKGTIVPRKIRGILHAA